jgi:hypothetical protein
MFTPISKLLTLLMKGFAKEPPLIFYGSLSIFLVYRDYSSKCSVKRTNGSLYKKRGGPAVVN